jgi:hypothetical protein
MNKKRVPLYERIPEIYRIKDAELKPPDQLEQYLALVEDVFGAIHKNIESLYHDHFIETCDDWVIPYIGDLLGTSHLKGKPRTLRADVAETIALRRRKGTIGAIELLTYNLTEWGVHCVELRENMVWNQHLNHQRPDVGGEPPYSLSTITRQIPIRGGTVTLRDPAMMSLLGTPFDPFGHIADVRPCVTDITIKYNLPNLAVFLWRLAAYRVPVSKPVSEGVHARDASINLIDYPNAAPEIARFNIHPLGEPVRLYNTHRYDPEITPPKITRVDEVPGPIPRERISDGAVSLGLETTGTLPEGSLASNRPAYMDYETYNDSVSDLESLDISDVGLQFHLPETKFAGQTWTFRGANLCAWEDGLNPPLAKREIAVDPVIGRAVFGVVDNQEGLSLEQKLLVTYTYGAVGKVGAHPVSRALPPQTLNDETIEEIRVDSVDKEDGLTVALNKLVGKTSPVLILIPNSLTYELDLDDLNVALKSNDGGVVSLCLKKSLIIRAVSGARPVIKLKRPLRFRPRDVVGANDVEQEKFNAEMDRLMVRLEGLYITRGDDWKTDYDDSTTVDDESEKEPLVARAALNKLEIIGCTLDPGGYLKLDGFRAPIFDSLRLAAGHGFTKQEEIVRFRQTPEIIIKRSVTGPLFIDKAHLLSLSDSILDAGSGVNDDPQLVCSGADADPYKSWGPQTKVKGVTFFGTMRVREISGKSCIWVHSLQVLNNQTGCIKYSYFSDVNDRLPQHHACVKGTEARLHFVSEIFGQAAYGQLARITDFRIRERGINDDAMGAFGLLFEAHKWRNLQIRFREFMPVGIRPLIITYNIGRTK